MLDAADFKETVRAKTDIVGLVGESVALQPRRGGSEFVGLCPFHDDHNPSMSVYPDRQSFRCWVCQEGGDVFSFVMKHENVPFVDALDLLAERAGIERPQRTGAPAGGGTDKPRLYDVLAWADRQFRTCLKAGREAAEARDYVAARGIAPEIAERFGLGYVPRDWNWLQSRARGTYTAADLLAAGVVREKKDGAGLNDFFVDRVMFPIRDERGRAVSFGGRVLPGRDDKAGPKYLNGGDTAVFNKSKLVYALDLARDGIKQTKTAVVMEGYTDVIAAHQAGYANVVATLGTALAESHVALLKRFAPKVVLVYDGDDAGLNAAERALTRFLAQDVDLRILALPQGLDPADFLANDDGGRFAELLADAPPALEFKLAAAVRRFGLDAAYTDYAASAVLKEVLSTVVAAPRIEGTGREAAVLRLLADRLGLRERAVHDELKRLRGEAPRPRERPPNPAPNAARDPNPARSQDAAREEDSGFAPVEPFRPDDAAERELLSVLLVRPDLFDYAASRVGPDDFTTPRLRSAYEYLRDVADLHGSPAYELLMSSTDDPETKRLLVGLDADARRKGLDEQLTTGPPGTGRPAGTGGGGPAETGSAGTAPPPLLVQTVETVVRRRTGRRLHQDGGRLARHLATGGPLDDAAKDRLRQFQKRLLAAKHAP